jgi:hypothetical protein
VAAGRGEGRGPAGRGGAREEEAAVGMKKGERHPENAAPERWRRILQHAMGVLLEPVQ